MSNKSAKSKPAHGSAEALFAYAFHAARFLPSTFRCFWTKEGTFTETSLQIADTAPFVEKAEILREEFTRLSKMSENLLCAIGVTGLSSSGSLSEIAMIGNDPDDWLADLSRIGASEGSAGSVTRIRCFGGQIIMAAVRESGAEKPLPEQALCDLTKELKKFPLDTSVGE